jgi:hypothetical protein
MVAYTPDRAEDEDMPAARDDYLIRLITQAAAVLRRLRERLRGGGAPEEVAREARDAVGELFGPQAGLLAMLDPASAAALVGDAERVAVWAGLLRVEAEAVRQSGDPARAAALDARANALDGAGGARPEPPPGGPV